ncbi:hypothetical protein HSBAA_15590 [Vreelandella sulfidaeris]|uniref:Glucan biosynthesis periplasmic MdoG C-terminal domain-containing protein n=1 Tax=Vreelandella sulfidaeris TaxID=115553 RepID=A0A455U4V1_9GAMM|nr:hypothetical protein HSBAA_15590 [Halomonas sulfidaeris]
MSLPFFSGASYFRIVGRNQAYGLSTRGLAIDTASTTGEEFPAFREFWMYKPDADAEHIELLALMDSPLSAAPIGLSSSLGKIPK